MALDRVVSDYTGQILNCYHHPRTSNFIKIADLFLFPITLTFNREHHYFVEIDPDRVRPVIFRNWNNPDDAVIAAACFLFVSVIFFNAVPVAVCVLSACVIKLVDSEQK